MASVRPQMGRRKPRPGFRWKAVSVPGPRPGTSITQHVEVPIDTLEPTQPTQVPAPQQDVTTVIKEYADETPNTRTTTIKGGLLGDMYDKFDPYGGTATGGGMDDPNWSRATAVNTPRPTNLPGTDFFGGDVLAPFPPRQNMGMVDPSWSPQVPGSNVPRVTNPPGTDFFGGGVTAPNGERAAILEARKRKFLEREAQELAARKKMREQTGGAAPTQAQIEESMSRYADSRRKQLTRPTMPEDTPGLRQPSRPVDTGSSIADARIAAIADANRIEAEAARMPRPGAVHAGQEGVAPVERPMPESWMIPEAGFVDPNWTTQVPGSNVPAPDPRRVAEQVAKQEAQGRLAAATLPSDFGQDDPAGYEGWSPGELDQYVEGRVGSPAQKRLAKAEIPIDYGQDDPSDFEGWDPEDLDRYIEARKKRLRGQESPYPSMAIDQESLEGTIYGKPSTGQKVAAEILGLAPDLYRRYINSLLMLLGAEEDDDILIETDPTEWILQKFKENPHMIRKSKDFILKAIKGTSGAVEAGGEGVANIAGETIDFWGDKLEDLAEEIGAEDKASIVPKLIEDTKDYWSNREYPASSWVSKLGEQHKRRVQDRLNRLDNEALGRAAIARGPDDPALLYDDPRRRVAQAAREKLPRMGIGRGPDLPDPSGVPKTDAEKKAVDKRVANADTTKIASATENKNELRDNPKLAALWGKYAYDPAARKKAYLDNLKQVYKKALMLDIIAQLTGGKSRSKEYLKMATTKLDAVDQFDQEQRVSNIWKQVFTGTNGQFYMPKNKREAAERAHFFGGDPKTVSSIFGSVPEERKVQYYRKDPNKTNEWEIIRSDVDPGPSYIAGQPRSKTPSGDELLADRKMKRYNDLLATYDSATGEDKAVALRNLENWASFAKLKTGGMTEQQNRAFAKSLWDIYFTEDDALLPGAPVFLEYYHGAGQFVLPKDDTGRKVGGWGAPGGGQTAGGGKEEGAAPQVAIDALRANPTKEMKKMFKDKYGYLPKEI